jgi:Tol biopolymer transport system component
MRARSTVTFGVVTALLAVALSTNACQPKPMVVTPASSMSVGPSASDAQTPSPTTLVAVGANAQDLQRVTSDPSDEVAPVLSPDNNQLLLTSLGYDANRAPVRQVLVGMSPTGSGTRTLYTSDKYIARGASWTPDGQSLIFVSNAIGGMFHLVKILASTPNGPLTVVVRADLAPELDRASVSPDGKQVAFEMGKTGSKFIGLSNLDGSGFTQVGEGRAPAYSPDGRRLAFVRRVGEFDQVFLANSQTGGEVIQLTKEAAHCRAPRWAPNGRFVTFATNRDWQKFQANGGTPEATWNVYAVRIDGAKLTQLTDGPVTSVQPFWAADGSVYFTSNQSGNFDIWRLRPKGELVAP